MVLQESHGQIRFRPCAVQATRSSEGVDSALSRSTVSALAIVPPQSCDLSRASRADGASLSLPLAQEMLNPP